ncbi:MAG: PAS domain S-box protein [Bacteroidales bacterium]
MMKSDLKLGIDRNKDGAGAFDRYEEIIRSMFSLSGDAILIVGGAGCLVMEANRVCHDMLGYSLNKLIGTSMQLIMPDFSSIEVDSGVTKAKIYSRESTWKRNDGHDLPVWITLKKTLTAGEPVYLIIARDLHEIKQKEQELKASDERYQDLVENSGEGFGMVDTDEKFTFVNPAACEIFGLPAQELVGKGLDEFLDPHSVDEIKHQTSLRKEGMKSMYELEIIRLDGERRWIIVTATPQHNTEGKFTGTFGIFRDITQRKLAETKVRESEQRLHEIVELTNDWIWEIDPSWKYSFVSPKIFDILGYLPDEMIGRSPFDFLMPQDVAKVKEGVRGMVHQFKPLNAIINRAIHKDGHIVYLETSGIAIFNEQGEYKGYRGADRDVTLRKLYERELIVAKEKAEESDRLKSSILSNMSHEFRTPLNGILGFAEILKEELGKSEYESMIDNIFNSGKRLMSTLNSIIMLSQLEGGKITISRKVVDLETSMLAVVKSMESLIAEKSIYLRTNWLRPFSVITDENLLNQLLHQILDNAIKFTDQGGITIETREVVESGKDWIVLTISDTGIGIDKKYYNLIFQEFRQVSEGFGRKYQGSGIGLSISMKIIELLNGRISIESETGKGSSFSIWLPNEKAPEMLKEPGISRGTLPAKGKGGTTHLPIILLVEDNLVNKELTTLFLRNICQVEYAPDGETAIKMAGSRQYRVILMDINLGYGMNGLDATREIRHIPGYELTPVIAVTGYTMAEDTEQLYAAGCTGHITKPFNKQTLLTMIQNLLHA